MWQAVVAVAEVLGAARPKIEFQRATAARSHDPLSPHGQSVPDDARTFVEREVYI